MRTRLVSGAVVAVLTALIPLAWAATGGQKNFPTPEAGIAALVEAVKINDQLRLRSILGPDGGKLINSGDPVADRQSRESFLKAYADANQVMRDGNARATLVIGNDQWPMPIPLVQENGAWRFDTRQGEREILARRIGRNELATIQVCLAIADAEREYAALDVDGDGMLEYAGKFVSAPGKRDGLYWRTKTDEHPSPLGPLLAAAAGEGYPKPGLKPLAPYHGYFYRMLQRQGPDAPGGAYEYIVKGKMIGGFALIAYPARYGASGIMSFMVNHDGVVYEKDLGGDTAAVAVRTTVFNPDSTWRRAEAPAR